DPSPHALVPRSPRLDPRFVDPRGEHSGRTAQREHDMERRNLTATFPTRRGNAPGVEAEDPRPMVLHLVEPRHVDAARTVAHDVGPVVVSGAGRDREATIGPSARDPPIAAHALEVDVECDRIRSPRRPHHEGSTPSVGGDPWAVLVLGERRPELAW